MAAAKHVEDLQLTFPVFYYLTPKLYATKTIKILRLSGVCFDSPAGFNNLNLLKDLYIENSSLGDETVREIASSCPNLENLTLQRCLGLSEVKIAGPSLCLKHLVFVNNENFIPLKGLELEAPNIVFFKYDGSIVPFSLKHLHCLSQVNLCFGALRWDFGGPLMDYTEIGHLKTTMDQLSHVKFLHVTTWFGQFIAKAYDTIGNGCFAFQNLKTFFWSGMLKTKEELFALVAFLGDCPSLEFLKMEFIYFRPTIAMLLNEEEPCFVIEGEEPKVRVGCLYQLRKIELHRFEGRPCETELIKVVLENAVVLDSLAVTFANCVGELRTEELIEQISLYPRGSCQAQVKFCKENSTSKF